jgi:hypothetical protein
MRAAAAIDVRISLQSMDQLLSRRKCTGLEWPETFEHESRTRGGNGKHTGRAGRVRPGYMGNTRVRAQG